MVCWIAPGVANGGLTNPLKYGVGDEQADAVEVPARVCVDVDAGDVDGKAAVVLVEVPCEN